jgi:two-component system, chemotaxis family, sensor kinase CheA
MSERVDLNEFIGGFVVEAEELLTTANACLLEIDVAITDGKSKPKAVRELFRALHTIKGLAGMVGVESIMELAHALETLLRTADRAGGTLQRGAVEVSLQAVRAIGERVRMVAEGRAVTPAPARLIEQIAGTDATSETVEAPPAIAADWDARLSASERQQVFHDIQAGVPAWTLAFVPSEDRAARGISIATVRSGLTALGEIIKVAPRTQLDASGKQAGIKFEILLLSSATAAQLAEVLDVDPATLAPISMPVTARATVEPEPEAEPDPEPDGARIGRSTVRVELARLDELQDQLGSLIVSRFRLERELAAQAARGHDVRKLREVADLQARQLRDLRRAILRVRMVRVAEVLEPLALLVRSVARTSHKEVRLELDVRDAELDKAVADRLLPALIHLVRNAVDHAIEPPDARVAAGKPRVGTVRIACTELASKQLELRISDDGRGIDREAIARRAHREVADTQELLDVLTTPGFSTRDAITQTSGRGVGMDIVKRVAVQELGGELALATELGAGTTFTLKVPLTIAIVEVFSFECARQPFVVPVAAIEEIFELGDDRIEPPGRPANGERDTRVTLIHRRGHALPLISLCARLAIDANTTAKNAMVIRHNGALIAFAIDRMLGRQEVVVRPVDDPLVRARGIAGATDLGDGRPTLVLDLSELGDGHERIGA